MQDQLAKVNKSELKPKERKFLNLVIAQNYSQADAYIATTRKSKQVTHDSARVLGARMMKRIKKKLSGRTSLRQQGLTIKGWFKSFSAFCGLRSGSTTRGDVSRKMKTASSNLKQQNCWRNSSVSENRSLTFIIPVPLILMFMCICPTMAGAVTMEIRPQPGPQETFLSTSADIAIYGGAAGGGKSYALLLEPLRNVKVPGFGSVIFRRTSPQITAEGGLWDQAAEIYPAVGGQAIQQPYRYSFKAPGTGRSKIEFHHLQHEKNVYDWQGSQIALIEFDEVTHFSQKQFFYMLSRNRSVCGVKPYMRAACNPDPDSWVKGFISWWLDDEGEYADPQKAGRIRWMVRSGDDILWFETRKEAIDYVRDLGTEELQPKSVTFIPANIQDNQILLEQDPGYLANLMAMPRVERERLLRGNWKLRATAGTIFARDDFEIIDSAPVPEREVRFWDRAATEPNPGNEDPDWTVSVKMQKSGGIFIVTDVTRFRAKSEKVKRAIRNTGSQDGTGCTIGLFQDPGQAGKYERDDYMHYLAGFSVQTIRETTKKYLKWQPFASQAQAGNVKLLRGDWNEAFLTELENVSEDPGEYAHDDQVDAVSGAFELLTHGRRWRPL